MSLKPIVLVAAALWAWPIAASDKDAVEFRHWKSPDSMELFLVSAAPAEAGGPRLYFFSNNATRVCYTFTVAGSWTFDKASGVMRSDDGRGSLGKDLLGPEKLVKDGGPELVRAAIQSYQAQFHETLLALASQGVKRISQPDYSVETFSVAGREAVKWTARATGQIKGQDASIAQHNFFVEVVPGWVLVIEARDDVAREAIESLGTAEPPDCYWPFLREHFPAVSPP